MIDRYKINEIETIWSDKQKFDNWLKIELLVCEALCELDIMPQKDLEYITKNIKLDINNVYELEKETKHDVVAFTRSIGNSIKTNAKKWIHYGLTSTDIVDTSNGINFKLSNDIIEANVERLLSTLKQLAIDNKYVKQIARTHGVHAQVNSLGLKFLNYYENISRWLSTFQIIRKQVEVVKLSGAVGNYSYQNPKIELIVSKKLNMDIAFNSTQVVSRDRHAMYFSVLANLGLLINQLATEIRHLHRTEVNEICEGFSLHQKGSSAMPHKKNPITCENICGMSRLLTGLCQTTWDNVNLWHERDISHSSNERIIFCDAISITVYMCQKMNGVLNNITINKDALQNNILKTQSTTQSQAILLHLINNTDESRETLYDFIQSTILKKEDIFKTLSESKFAESFKGKKLEEFKKLSDELQYIDFIYKRAGI